MRYARECWGLDSGYAYLNTTVFPRGAKRLTILLEERENETATTWHEAAHFYLDNPTVAFARAWPKSKIARSQRFEELEFTLGHTVVHIPANQTDLRLRFVRATDHPTLTGIWWEDA